MGDVVEFYFVIPGLNEKARRAEGTVESVSESTFTVTVNDATRTGKIAVGDKVAILRAADPKAEMKPSPKDKPVPPVTPLPVKPSPKKPTPKEPTPKGEMKTPPPAKPLPPAVKESTSPRIRNVPEEYATIEKTVLQ